MYNPLLATILFALSFFYSSVVADAAPYAPGPALSVRQAAGEATGRNAPQCLEYARTANLSTIGANSTYRATYFQMSSVGTQINARMLNAAIAALPAMTANQGLNDQCGNWTEISVLEAEKNFTEARVLEFENVIQDAQAIKAGPELIGMVIMINAIFIVVWSFMP